jgi:peptidyl-prolyl cis-trans isomerase D
MPLFGRNKPHRSRNSFANHGAPGLDLVADSPNQEVYLRFTFSDSDPMFTWMRTHQRKLWLVITILTIVSFIVLYNSSQLENLRSDSFARVYGKNLSITDFQRQGRKFQLAITLGLTQYASTLGGGGDQGIVDFVINSTVVEHEAKALGIAPTEDDVKNAIIALPVFQTNGQFDPKKYAQLVETALTPQGFTERELNDIVRGSLVLQRIKQLIDSAPAVSDTETAFLRRMFQPVTGAAIVFKLEDFAKNVKPTDAEIEAYFKTNAARFVTPEWRSVRYVSFPLPTDAQKLEGKAKIDAQQKVADASDTFATRAATEGFEKAAQALGLKVETTPAFNQQGQINSTSPDAAAQAISSAGPVATLAPVAFTLSQKAPVSGVIQNGDTGFLVAELANVTPSRPMTLDEAKPEIVQALTDTTARTALQKAATDAIAKLRAAIKGGQPFAQAATAAGLKTETFANLSLFDQNTPPNQGRYGEPATRLEENEIGGFQPSEEGGFIVWLEKRSPLDEKTYAQYRDMLTSQTLSTRERILWLEWLHNAQKEAGIAFPGENRG